MAADRGGAGVRERAGAPRGLCPSQGLHREQVPVSEPGMERDPSGIGVQPEEAGAAGLFGARTGVARERLARARAAPGAPPRSSPGPPPCPPARARSRSTIGSSSPVSAVLPGSISGQHGRPSPSRTAARTRCRRAGRWAFAGPGAPSVAPPAPGNDRGGVARNPTDRSGNSKRLRPHSRVSPASFPPRGASAPAADASPSSPSQANAREGGKPHPRAPTDRLGGHPRLAWPVRTRHEPPRQHAHAYCALYAGYSSDQQRVALIEDQFRVCRERAAREGWKIAGAYKDSAISGGNMILCPGIHALLEDTLRVLFEILAAEVLDRVSRDQADGATLYKHLRFSGVTVVTLAEGEISELHFGLKRTMNALFLKDLAAKMHRGLRGRVKQSRSGGGACYGYDVVKAVDGTEDPVRDGRMVNEPEAETVRRVFREFASGASSRAIAKRLNGEGITGPSGKLWTDSTIRGHAKHGTGLINNEFYIGRLVWSRLRYVKNLETGKRVSRINPPEEWIVAEVPDSTSSTTCCGRRSRTARGKSRSNTPPSSRPRKPHAPTG